MENKLTEEQVTALLDHFYYSVDCLNSYNELTISEKKIISEEIYNSLIDLKNDKKKN